MDLRTSTVLVLSYRETVLNSCGQSLTGQSRCVSSDPPWGVDYVARREKFSEVEIANDKIVDYKILMDKFASELFRIIKKNGSVYIFSGGGVLKMLEGENKSKILHWNTWFTMEAFFKVRIHPKSSSVLG